VHHTPAGRPQPGEPDPNDFALPAAWVALSPSVVRPTALASVLPYRLVNLQAELYDTLENGTHVELSVLVRAAFYSVGGLAALGIQAAGPVGPQPICVASARRAMVDWEG
jgi:hypothetical protein